MAKHHYPKHRLGETIVWQGEHPIAAAAQKVKFIADERYELTPLIQPFADLPNKTAVNGYETREVNKNKISLKKHLCHLVWQKDKYLQNMI